jgi:ribonuclease BN (tRNA processing enzyme)
LTLTLHVLGSSGSWPAPGLATSGYVISDETTQLVVEQGFGTMLRLTDPSSVDGVVVSHRHPDHCADVLALYHLWAYGSQPRRGVPLLAPGSVLDSLVAFIDATSRSSLFDVFDARPVESGDRDSVGSLELSFVGMDHSVATVGVNVTGGGRSLFFTGDTGMAGEWRTAIDAPNLLLAEATWQGNGDGGAYRQHLTATEAGGVATAVGAEQLVLTHLKPGLDPLRSVAEARKTYAGPVSHADQGRTIKV